MIIDFHTHIFPDKLAPRALGTLLHNSKDTGYTPVTDMTANGLLAYMDANNIDKSVILPVLTKASQLVTTNTWSAGLASDRFICFGGVYPHTEDYKADIDYVVSLGIKGLKFHAEYQDFYVDDPKMIKIYDYAMSKGLIVIHHAGYDPIGVAPYKSSPMRFRKVIDALQGGTFVVGHLGGQSQWDDVEKYLAGTNAYIETSMGFDHYSQAQFLRILAKHDPKKMLFGSDSPWSDAKKEIAAIKSLPISDEMKADILGLNAKRLLNI
ncbi:MAG: amidohydrolase family protein [Bacillota bacterium]